jgi:hypothetical protein
VPNDRRTPLTNVLIAKIGNAMFSFSMAKYSATERSGAPLLVAASSRMSLAKAVPSHPTDTMMCEASKNLYMEGETRRSPCLLRENKAFIPFSIRFPNSMIEGVSKWTLKEI